MGRTQDSDSGCLFSRTAVIHLQMAFPSSPGPLKQHPMSRRLPLKSCPAATRMMFQRCEFGSVPLSLTKSSVVPHCLWDLAQSHCCHSDILLEGHMDTCPLMSLKHPPRRINWTYLYHCCSHLDFLEVFNVDLKCLKLLVFDRACLQRW